MGLSAQAMTNRDLDNTLFAISGFSNSNALVGISIDAVVHVHTVKNFLVGLFAPLGSVV